MALTDTKIKQSKPKEKDYKLSDEKGLFVLVKKNGAKYWRHKYRFANKEKLASYGVYPEVSLKEAREKRDQSRALLRDGLDPSTIKKEEKLQRKFEGANTFKDVANEWYVKESPHWTEKHSSRVNRAILKDLNPSIGSLPIAQITPPQLLSALQKIEKRGAIETAQRTKQIAGKIFRFGASTGRCERDISSDLREALSKPKKKHLAAITKPKEVGELLRKIESYQGGFVVCSALKLAPLVFVRPKELRHAEWSEIDFRKSQWEIPAQKMKMREPHIVPLSSQARDILKALQPLTGSGKYVFPSPKSGSRPMSDNAILAALRSMDVPKDKMTGHGFRAMARTLLDEELGYRIDWIEHQLAHTVKDTNGRAYNRTSHLKPRKEMMQSWSNYLNGLRKND